MARRAVFEVELGPRGRTHDARWGYFHDDETEFVAAHVGAATITVLLEDGGIVVLSRADGRELRRIWDDRYCLGAVFLDVERGQPISAPGCGPRCLASAQSLEWRSEQQCSGLGAGCRMTAAQITDDCEVG
jgi:hypothetical protein